jgi:hypothetical protein
MPVQTFLAHYDTTATGRKIGTAEVAGEKDVTRMFADVLEEIGELLLALRTFARA